MEGLALEPLHLLLGEPQTIRGAGQREGVILPKAQMQHILLDGLKLLHLPVQPAVVLLGGQGGGHRDQVTQTDFPFLAAHRLIQGNGVGLVGDP